MPARHSMRFRRPAGGWDFSRGIDTQTINDIGPQACHGRLVNLPTRAVVGTRWTGREQCWRHAPQRLRRDPFSRRRSGRLRLASGFLLDRAGRSAQRRLCAASDLRCRRGLAAALRAAAAGRARSRRSLSLPRPSPIRPTPTTRAQRRSTGILRARRGMGRLSLQSARVSDLRTLDLQQAPRRQRHFVLVAPSADPDDAAGLPDIQRSARLRHAALSGGPASAGVAGGEGFRLRHRHGRGPGRRRRRADRAVSHGADRIASGIPHARHARCAGGLYATGWPAVLSRRQRLLLAHRARQGARRI